MNGWSYPRYALSERIADGVIHALGVILALTGAVWLLLAAAPPVMPVLAIYAGALVFGLGASALYHMTPWEGPRPLLRRIDHAAIYLKIAATYTPVAVLIGSGYALAVLALVWGLALIGAVAKLAFWRDPGRMGPFLYLGLGWLSVLLIGPVMEAFPPGVAALIGLGGLFYSIGVVFFTRTQLKFAMPIWHGFVLMASACLFGAISLAALTPP